MGRPFSCRVAVLASVPPSVLLLAAAPATGQAVSGSTSQADAASNAEMMALIRQQAERIRELEARLDRVENRAGAVASQATAPASPAAPQGSATGQISASTAQSKTVAPDLALTRAQSPTQAPLTAKAAPPLPDLAVTWGTGAPVFGKSDGSFTFKPRGRLLLDFDSSFGSRVETRNVETTGLRAARLGVEGTFLYHGFYQFEADFAEGKLGIVGAFIGYQNKIGRTEYDARVGNMFNDRSLEGQTGSLTTPFIERNFVANAIVPQKGYYGMGTMLRVFGPNWHVSASVTGDPVDGNYTTSDTLGVSSRAHWNPVKSENLTLHVGAWAFHEWLSNSARTITSNTAIGARFDTALGVATGPLIDAKSSTGYGAELAAIYRNFYGWGEYGRRELAFLAAAPTANFATDAWSISAGWFLTGETPPYSARQGNFIAPKILHSLADGGPGAVELLARHERLDYSRTPLGGTGVETTVGANWYPVPLVRLMINWSHWRTDNRVAPAIGRDSGDSISTRAQFNF